MQINFVLFFSKELDVGVCNGSQMMFADYSATMMPKVMLFFYQFLYVCQCICFGMLVHLLGSSRS